MIATIKRIVESVLEWMVIVQMILLTVVVIVAVLYRLAGDSLSWYDEVAAIQLSWITYYGAALAALKRRHIGFDSVLLSLPLPLRTATDAAGLAVLLICTYVPSIPMFVVEYFYR